VASVFQENYYSKLFPEINFPKVGAENEKKDTVKATVSFTIFT
jgi:hypothetical protein